MERIRGGESSVHTERPINADRVAGRARRVFNYWRTCRGGRGGGKGAIGGAEGGGDRRRGRIGRAGDGIEM